MKFNLTLACLCLFFSIASASKKVFKTLAAGVGVSAGIYFHPYALHLDESNESLAFWYKALRNNPEGEFLFRHRLYPSFVINGRFTDNQSTLLLKSLIIPDETFCNSLLIAGADPNAVDKWGKGFFDHAHLNDDFPLSVLKNAQARGLDLNHPSNGQLPLDRVLKRGSYDLAAFLVKRNAKSSRDWSQVLYDVSDVNYSVPKHQHHLNLPSIYSVHRLIIQIYRASGWDKAILERALWRAYWEGREEMRAFLLRIDEFDVMLEDLYDDDVE